MSDGTLSSPSTPILTIDYQGTASAAEDRRRKWLRWCRRALAPISAACWVMICAIAGVVVKMANMAWPWHGAEVVFVLPIWVGGAWYELARVMQSKSYWWAKLQISAAAIICFIAAPSLLFVSNWDYSYKSSQLYYMWTYRWQYSGVETGDRVALGGILVASAWIVVVQAIDLICHRRAAARQT